METKGKQVETGGICTEWLLNSSKSASPENKVEGNWTLRNYLKPNTPYTLLAALFCHYGRCCCCCCSNQRLCWRLFSRSVPSIVFPLGSFWRSQVFKGLFVSSCFQLQEWGWGGVGWGGGGWVVTSALCSAGPHKSALRYTFTPSAANWFPAPCEASLPLENWEPRKLFSLWHTHTHFYASMHGRTCVSK